MMRQRMLRVGLTLGLLAVVTATLVGILSHTPSQAKAAGATYATIGSQALTNMTKDFYTNGQWKTCLSCSALNVDWGDDAMTYDLWLRWKINNHDASVVPDLLALSGTAITYGPPCATASSCGQSQLSDVPMWDSIALGREYEATGSNSSTILAKEEAAFNFVDQAGSSVFAAGACPGIRYQHPGGGSNQLKTLETDANYIKAALLLYRYTKNQHYLTQAENTYAAVRTYFLDPTLKLYSVYVFDNGSSCSQLQGRFYASVNGDMIYNGLTLAGNTTGNQSQQYLKDAIATGQAVANDLSDANGVYTDMQAENDVEEPLIEGMYDLATQQNQGFATSWLQAAASASASSLKSTGAYSRIFDGPADQGTINVWQTNGGYALAFAEAGLNPNGSPATTMAWANAMSTPSSIDTATGTQLPASINFTGSGIALIGTLGEQCCEPGHARVFVDGKETTDTTGIWQNKTNWNLVMPNSVLFAWRWPKSGSHTITIYPGVYNAKEGGSFIHIQSYLVAP